MPGYLPVTPRELACAWAALDTYPATVYEGAWGGAGAWWVWRGDFDGDGRPDRATVLVHPAVRADPQAAIDDLPRHRLLVLLATGRALAVAHDVAGLAVVVDRQGWQRGLPEVPRAAGRADALRVGHQAPVWYYVLRGRLVAYEPDVEDE